MERPNPLDYENFRVYHAKLVEYCDELEEKLASCMDAESGFSHSIEYLEKQILIRDEKIIAKNKEILELNRLLERTIDLLEEGGLCVNSVGLSIGSVKCDAYKNCDDCWMEALKEVQDD